MHIPITTYRLQLNHKFNFQDVCSCLDYFSRLGITDLYFSPITQARPKSLHGYDVVNPRHINEELGGFNNFIDLANEIKRKNMNILLDIVPNHMAVSELNLWWQDIITHYNQSKYANFFDINWNYSKLGQVVYRRFFDIDDLVCLNMQNISVFEEVHTLILHLLDKNLIQGLRIDHIDGLLDPLAYLKLLNTKINKPTYIVVEKILARDEAIPNNWPVNGTTGYDFLNVVNSLFIEPKGFKYLNDFYLNTIKSNQDIAEISYLMNKKVIEELFIKELDRLAIELWDIAKSIAPTLSQENVRTAIIEVSSHMRHYRTYIQNTEYNAHDQAIIDQLLIRVRQRQILDSETFQFIEKILWMKFDANLNTEIETRWQHWIMRWQVFTSPMIAKGFEDTTCYLYNAFLSSNEVGSGVEFFERAGDLAYFHEYNHYQSQNFPYHLNATSTHDTKRSEDVRARLNVLSELSEQWKQLFNRWAKHNNTISLDINSQFFLYQTLIATCPLENNLTVAYTDRLIKYLIKASKEAKINNSWKIPDIEYENSLRDFITTLLQTDQSNKFLDEFLIFKNKISFYGMLNSLAQLILKMTVPGVPDLYQGNEVFEFDMVDPDNRHGVDYTRLNKLLNNLLDEEFINQDKLLTNLIAKWQDGRIKLYLTYKLINLRNNYSSLFLKGSYIPLKTEGGKANNVIAFLRNFENQWLLVIVSRWFTQIINDYKLPYGNEIWQNTLIYFPSHISSSIPKSWQPLFSEKEIKIHESLQGEYLHVADCLNLIPMAVFLAEMPLIKPH